ncbi:MAG: hypothetical protein IT259_17275 [Saprospiraceae bacterium]|nr:hypothetical protein [Saprospiraceae bacterium]
MLTLLSVVIGIVFVMLLFSLLTTTVMEMIAGFFSLRGKHLVQALQNMLGNKTMDFLQHPYYQQLTMNANVKGAKRAAEKAFPSYIGSGTFSAILNDILDGDPQERIGERVNALPDGELKKVLSFLWREADENVTEFRNKTEEWFNEVMDRASGWYKRKSRTWLLLVGGVITIIFNVDALQIYTNLSVNATLSEYVADAATAFVNNQPAVVDSIGSANPDFFTAQKQFNDLVNNNISAISSPLGLGWEAVDWSKADRQWWMYKIIGWLTTTLALSLGATFWFGVLKQLIGLRSSGPSSTGGLTTVSSSGGSGGGGGSFLTRPGAESPLESVGRGAKKPPAGGNESTGKKEMPDG